MATAKIAYRRSAIGISAGLGIALPLAAYAATLPMEGVNDAVRMGATPFAAGVLAGVGVLAISGGLLDRRATRLEAEAAEAERFASIFSDSDVVVPQTARSDASRTGSAPRAGKRFSSDAPKGVPVISRAVDALDEAEAWAEIDAMFSDDSPISCDPTRSKDMYQIAIEELRRTEQMRAAEASARAADASDRTAAMAALYGASVVAASRQAVVAPISAAAVTNASVPVAAPAPVAPAPVAPNVPVADYSGHEDMWASALAILDEPVGTHVSASAPVSCMSQSTGASASASADQASETSFVSRGRMAAVAEGGNATRLHSRVNALIEQEFEKFPSSSVRHSTHEYLKVIDGGTASMPAFRKAEA